MDIDQTVEAVLEAIERIAASREYRQESSLWVGFLTWRQ